MCRLFAYIHSGPPAPIKTALGYELLGQFQGLARVHRDGWGAAWLGPDGLGHYRSTTPADQDGASFATVAERNVTAAVIHERWASPGIVLSLDNQQPFTSGGIVFAHNGTIANESGNIVDRPTDFREALGLVHSTTGSDSKIYAEVFYARLRDIQTNQGTKNQAPTADQACRAVSSAIELLRQEYPDAGYNAVVQTAGFTLVVQAHTQGGAPSETVRRVYQKVGWEDRAESYYELVYTTTSHNGSVTTAASSSGYTATDGWTKLGNNMALVISHDDAATKLFQIR